MKVLNAIILNCEKASLYIQKNQEGTLDLKGRVQLRLHLMVCKFCRAYEKQSQKLNELIGQHFSPSPTESNSEFKDQLKAQIQKKSTD